MRIWSFICKQQKLAPLHVLTVPTGNSSAEQKIQVKVHSSKICVKMVLIIMIMSSLLITASQRVLPDISHVGICAAPKGDGFGAF